IKGINSNCGGHYFASEVSSLFLMKHGFGPPSAAHSQPSGKASMPRPDAQWAGAVFGNGGGIFICFSFSWYSGYIVSAPPRVASKGIRYLRANSSRNLFVPGK